MFNASAPDFPQSVQQTFREDEQIKSNLRKSFKVFLSFLGLELGQSGVVSRADNFEERAGNWLEVSMLGSPVAGCLLWKHSSGRVLR